MERENIPGPTWQSIWINLTSKANAEWCSGSYSDSWNTTQELYSWLPQECKAEVQNHIETIRTKLKDIDMAARKTSYSIVVYQRKAMAARREYLHSALLNAHEAIEKSLEAHGWICKVSGASPQVKHMKPAHF